MAKLIPLARGFETIVDDEDYELLMQWQWNLVARCGLHYAVRWEKRQAISIHRVLTQATKGQIIDHIDGNGLNNQRANLRFCTHAENMRNCKSRAGASKFKGVCVDRRRPSPYRACIKSNGERIYLGSFATEIAAALAYDEAARRLHGEFARTNFKHVTDEGEA